MSIAALTNYPFKWHTSRLKYLGIYIHTGLANMVRDNIDPLRLKISSDLARWNTLNLSLWGRIQIYKMNIMPRLNYLFFMIPYMSPPLHYMT